MPRCPEMYMYTFVRFFVIFSTSTCFFFVENVNWSRIFVCWSCDVSLTKMVDINQRSWVLISKTWNMVEKIISLVHKCEWLNIWMWPCRLFSQSFEIFEKVLVHGSNPAVFTAPTDRVAFKGHVLGMCLLMLQKSCTSWGRLYGYPISELYIYILTGAGFLNHQHCVVFC